MPYLFRASLRAIEENPMPKLTASLQKFDRSYVKAMKTVFSLLAKCLTEENRKGAVSKSLYLSFLSPKAPWDGNATLREEIKKKHLIHLQSWYFSDISPFSINNKGLQGWRKTKFKKRLAMDYCDLIFMTCHVPSAPPSCRLLLKFIALFTSPPFSEHDEEEEERILKTVCFTVDKNQWSDLCSRKNVNFFAVLMTEIFFSGKFSSKFSK